MLRALLPLAAVAALAPALGACGDDGGAGDRPSVVVTTGVLGDVVTDLVGDAADVEVVLPAGADPHDFQPSPRQAVALRSADALITNGAGFEVGLGPAIEAAEEEGVPTHHAIDAVDALGEDEDGADGDGHAEEEGGADAHGHAEGGAHSGHDHGGADPHFFTDPDRMAVAAEAIAAFLADQVPALATEAGRARAADVVQGLRDLAAEVDEVLAPIPPEDRVVATNHDVLGYFAERFDLTVVGAVVPGGGTQGEPSARDLADLVDAIEAEGARAIVVDASAPARVAEAVAAEVDGGIEVVALHTESLGEEGSGADTYAGMVRTNAERLAEALG